MLIGMQNCVMEWSFRSTKKYQDPFNEVDFSVVFTSPDSRQQTVPGFWAGGDVWRVRYSSPLTGRYAYQTTCSQASDSGLHGKTGEFEIAPCKDDNPLHVHGAVRVSADKRHFEHTDGTPFFWLADTWWMGMCKRLRWPDDFQTLAADRVKKGFSVVQMVMGLYPDMPAFDPRGANEAGFPWDEDYHSINPAYFDKADVRIDWLVNSGLVPCLCGSWGYYLNWMGIEVMKKHWRHIVARYGAYPVVWCLAGEGKMPYYLSEDKEKDAAFLVKGWTQIARYVREVDPFGRMITIHPTVFDYGSSQVEDGSVLDFDMIQAGHTDSAIATAAAIVNKAYIRKPTMPVIIGEGFYEGIGGACWQNIQRHIFWLSILNGASGHTYGANGIWQVNTRREPYGPSPHGNHKFSWDGMPWEDAYKLPGSAHVGIGKRFLEKYQWWKLEPRPEYIETQGETSKYTEPFSGGIGNDVRFIYMRPESCFGGIVVKQLDTTSKYRAMWFNPASGEETPIGVIKPNNKGKWALPIAPLFQDLVVVIERE